MNRIILNVIGVVSISWFIFCILHASNSDEVLLLLLNFIAFLSIYLAARFVAKDYVVLLPTLTFLSAISLISTIGRIGYFVVFQEVARLSWYFRDLAMSDLLVPSLQNAVFNVMLVAGYLILFNRKRLPTSVQTISPVLPKGYPLALILIAVMALIGAYVFVSVLGISDIFSSQKRAILTQDGQRFALGPTQILVTPAFGLFVILYAKYNFSPKRNRTLAFAVILCVVFLIWWSFLRSIRAELLLVIFAGCQVYAASGKKVPIVGMGILSVCMVALFAAQTVIRATRSKLVAAYGSNEGIIFEITRPFFGEFNLGGPVALHYTKEVVPSIIPHNFGASFLQFIWLLVPRSIWEGKPQTVGNQFLAAIQPEHSLRLGGGVATGLVGDSYLAFGVLGLILVPFFFGMLLVKVDRKTALAKTITSFCILTVLQLYLVYMSYGYFFSKGLVDFMTVIMPIIILRLAISTPFYLTRRVQI